MNPQKSVGHIVGMAGRRIDRAGASKIKFPTRAIPRIRKDIRQFFVDEKVRRLICSAACGADLIALELALRMDIPVHVILPSEIAEFRRTSVIDRPGDWGGIFDAVIEKAQRNGSLQLLDQVTTDESAYRLVNEVILERLETSLLKEGPTRAALGLVVWDGHSQGAHDMTNHFRELALHKGIRVREILTI